MKLITLLLFIFLSITTAKAEMYSMRSCMLLPITDNIGEALAFKVYEETEKYLKQASWCNYKPSSELLNVFSKYRDKLDEHLEDPTVLKTVADRLEVGTLIKLKIEGTSDSVTLELKIFGENGRDLYLSEKVLLNKVDIFLINETVKNWLELYEVAIPYDGKVLGVLGKQVTFRAGNRQDFKVGQKILIKKLLRKKEHPLLQKVVAWETILIAKGTIKNISYDQGLATIEEYTSSKKVVKGDWVVIGGEDQSDKDFFNKDRAFEKNKQYGFGRLGELDLSFDLSNVSVGVSKSSGNIKLGGNIYGISAEMEAWLTRDYFVMGNFSRRVGTIKDISGSPTLDNATITSGNYKVGAGFKYLPMGFFYGPQVNIYGGYASYFYDIEDSAVDYLGEGNISGLFAGIAGNMPIQKGIRAFIKGEIIPFSQFEEDGSIYGSAKTSSSMNFEAGAKIQYNPVMRIRGSIEMINNSAKFKSGLSELNYKDTIFKIGLNYTF